MGGLGNYAYACEGFLDELKSSLSKDQIESLRADCTELGLDAWLDWFLLNKSEIVSFVAATPSGRMAKKKWQHPVNLPRLVLGAYHHVWQALQLLDVLREVPITPGGSYRNMAVVAGELYMRIRYGKSLPLWPFGEKNPFK